MASVTKDTKYVIFTNDSLVGLLKEIAEWIEKNNPDYVWEVIIDTYKTDDFEYNGYLVYPANA